MKKLFLNQSWAFTIGLVLVIPALYFVVSNILNYAFGIPILWRAIEPIFEKQGNESLGWSINLLIAIGPVIAFLLNIFRVMRISFSHDDKGVDIKFHFKRLYWSWLIVAASLFTLGTMFLYLLGENCNC